MNHATSNPNRQGKSNGFQTQLQTIFAELQKCPVTASMLSDTTGVPQKNICRYKRDLERCGMLWEVKKATCQKTGYMAWYITTDPTQAPQKPEQLKLFGE